MRPLTLSALSGVASLTFALTPRSFLGQLDISHTSSTTTLTYILFFFFSLIATLACLWIALSYLVLVYTHQSRLTNSSRLRFVARLTIPRVRHHILASMALSLAMAQPAYAQDTTNLPDHSPIDISWGSSELLELTKEVASNNPPADFTPTADSTLETETPPLTQLNLLTSPTDTPSTYSTTPMKEEMPSQTPPPQTSPSIHSIHSTPPNNIYTVKSGDTLWDIAKAHLPPNSPDNAVAQACLIWHVANPALANPNLIFPKQTLTIPQEYLS